MQSNRATPLTSTVRRPSKKSARWALAALTALSILGAACSESSAERDSGARAANPRDKNSHDGSDLAATDAATSAELSAVLAEHGVPGLKFTNVGQDAGLTEVQSDEAIAKTETMTSGAAVADVDGDGYDDIFLTRAGRTNLLYLNNRDGTFTESAREAGVSGRSVGYGSSAAAFFDADGDGSLDLFVSGFGKGTNVLYMNDGKGRFSDQTEARGVFMPLAEATELANIHGVTVGDVNNDGHLDLLVLQWYSAMYSKPITDQVTALSESRGDKTGRSVAPCEAKQLAVDSGYPTGEGQEPVRSALYINDGSGHFSDQAAKFGLDLNHILAFTGVFHDMNGDGWADLAITGDGCTSRLFRNVDGKRFDDITTSAGVGTDENGMGSLIRDFNGDGAPDWLVSAIYFDAPDGRCPVGGVIFGCSGNRLYLNSTGPDGATRFNDATDDYGLRDGGWGWGIAAEDFANTGSTQVAMTNGYDIGELNSSKGEPAYEYMSTFPNDRTRFWAWSSKAKRYRDIAEAVGITDSGLGHAMIPFDMDNDGDLDLLVVPAGAKPVLYRNDTPDDRSWLTVRLSDPARPGNSTGEGARIEVRSDADSEPAVYWIGSGGSYESQKPPEVHLGFGERKKPLSRIDVFWPGAQEPTTYNDVKLNQKLAFTPSGSRQVSEK